MQISAFCHFFADTKIQKVRRTSNVFRSRSESFAIFENGFVNSETFAQKTQLSTALGFANSAIFAVGRLGGCLYGSASFRVGTSWVSPFSLSECKGGHFLRTLSNADINHS